MWKSYVIITTLLNRVKDFGHTEESSVQRGRDHLGREKWETEKDKEDKRSDNIETDRTGRIGNRNCLADEKVASWKARKSGR